MLVALASGAPAQSPAWIHQLGTSAVDFVRVAVPDGMGGVYIGEETSLTRFNAAGAPLWQAPAAPAAGYGIYAAAPDAAGGVFVAARTSPAVWLARYDQAGNQSWSLPYGGAFTQEWPYAAASDGAGGVFVGGMTYTGLGTWDAWVARFDSAGALVWTRRIGTNGPPNDSVHAAVSDGAGGVYVGGHTLSNLGGAGAAYHDAWLARYDSAGNQLWIRQLGTPEADFLDAAATDGIGGVFVGGTTCANLAGPYAGPTPPGLVGDAWLARYDGSGVQVWIRQFGTGGEDAVTAAAPDGYGGVYVGGTTRGSLGGLQAGNGDAWLARYDSAGYRLWLDQLGTSASDGATAAASDGAGGVYLGGVTGGSLGGPFAGGLQDGWLAHYELGLTTRYCSPGIANSTGQPGLLTAAGSRVILDNDMTLTATFLPSNAFGFFLTSQVRGFVMAPGGSAGNLCVGGAIGRYVGPGQIQSSGATGSFDLVLDLSSTPTPAGLVQVLPGETWNFQAWHRDSLVGFPTSNFTDALSIAFE